MCKKSGVCFNEIIWLITTKMRLKKKNGWHGYDTDRLRPRHGHKHIKYKMSQYDDYLS